VFEFKKILIDRSECILFHIEKSDNYSSGWIGGNIPEYFLKQCEFMKEHHSKYYFYLALVNPFNSQYMFSIFVPQNYNVYLNNNAYPSCSILIVEHPISDESNNTDFTNTDIRRHAISSGEVSANFSEQFVDGEVYPVWMANGEIISDDDVPEYFIKFGGSPILIQAEDYYTEVLQRDSFEFLFQIDEQGYPNSDDFLNGNMPFSFGAVYIYAKIKDNSIDKPCVGYWQFS